MSRQLIAPGKYKAKPIKWGTGESGTGTPYIAVQFELPSGETITWWGYVTERSIDRVIESLRYCGWWGHELAKMGEEGMGTKEPIIVVEHEEYNGEVRDRVRWVNSGERGVSVGGGMDAQTERAFAARMAQAARAFDAERKHTGQARQTSGSLDAGNSFDDEIPF